MIPMYLTSDIGHVPIIQTQLFMEQIEQLKEEVQNSNEALKYHNHVARKINNNLISRLMSPGFTNSKC